jgi:hypothetical protein
VPHSPRLAFLIRQFRREIERQHRRDAETLSRIVRALRSPRSLASADAARFGELVRMMVRDELDCRRELNFVSDHNH